MLSSSLCGYHGYVGQNLNSSDLNKRQLEILNELNSDEDFADLCESYFQDIDSLIIKDDENKAYEGGAHNRENRLLWGQIRSGTFGYGATLKNRKTRKETYKRSIDDIELLPYTYMLYIPSGYKECILILQKYGNLGIKSVLTKSLIERFNTEHEDEKLKLEFKPYLDAGVFYNYIQNGELLKIHFIKRSLTKDIADIVGEDAVNKEAYTELIVKMKPRYLRKLLGPQIIERLERGESTAGLMKLNIGFEYDVMKLDIRHNQTQKQKVFELIDTDGFIESREIKATGSNKVNGLPTYEYTCKCAFDYLTELCHNLNIIAPVKPESFIDKGE